MKSELQIGFAITKDADPQIILLIVADGQVVQQKEITAEIMSVVASKVLAQGGKAIGTMVNPDGTQGDKIKFTASKVEAFH